MIDVCQGDWKILLSGKLQNYKKYQPESLKIGLRAIFFKKQPSCLYIDISPSILTTKP